mgnify:CR=1 FL=1
MKRLLIFLLIVTCFSYGLYKLKYRTYRWNQRLNLTVTTPFGDKSGSSVVEVTHWFHPNIPIDAGVRNSRRRGEAVVVDLGKNRFLFAMMDSDDLIAEAFGDQLPELRYSQNNLKRYFRAIKRLTGTVVVPVQGLPTLVTFSDFDDPSSVMLVDPNNLAAAFGEGYALSEATLEITKDPVTKDLVENALPESFFEYLSKIHQEALKRGLEDPYFSSTLFEVISNRQSFILN